jgi:serine/threonine protein kinase
MYASTRSKKKDKEKNSHKKSPDNWSISPFFDEGSSSSGPVGGSHSISVTKKVRHFFQEKISKKYKLSTLVEDVANHYEGQHVPHIQYKIRILQQYLLYHFEQQKNQYTADNMRNSTFTIAAFEQVIINKHGSIVPIKVMLDADINWRQSKNTAASSPWDNPNRVEIKLHNTPILGEGAFSSPSPVSYSIKLAGDIEQMIFVNVKKQKNKIVKPIEKKCYIVEPDILASNEYNAAKLAFKRRVHVSKTLINSKMGLRFFDVVTMPLIKGKNLEIFLEEIKNNENPNDKYRLPDVKIIAMINTACALRRLHTMDITHKDIKKTNVILVKNYISIIIDFNFSQINSDTLSAGCTPLYAAPEVINYMLSPYHDAELSASLDIYSLGLLFAEMYGVVLENDSGNSSWSNASSNSSSTSSNTSNSQFQFNWYYELDGKLVNGVRYLHLKTREAIQDACFSSQVTQIILDMISWDANERPDLATVIMNLLPLIRVGKKVNKQSTDPFNDNEYNIIYQAMIWNLICTEVFVLVTEIAKLNSLQDNDKKIITELTDLAYVNQEFNDPAPEDETKSIGQYKFEQLGVFASQYLSLVQDENLKLIFEILSKHGEQDKQDLYKQLCEVIITESELAVSNSPRLVI